MAGNKRQSSLSERIPADVRERAQRAGVDVKNIDWYAGRLDVTTEASTTFGDIPDDELSTLQGIADRQRERRGKTPVANIVAAVGGLFRKHPRRRPRSVE